MSVTKIRHFVCQFQLVIFNLQLSCDSKSAGAQNDDAESNFHGPIGLVLHNSMGIVPILPDLGTICAG